LQGGDKNTKTFLTRSWIYASRQVGKKAVPLTQERHDLSGRAFKIRSVECSLHLTPTFFKMIFYPSFLEYEGRSKSDVLQGGNKSTKSFRSDIGIPGYTGFCPAFAALPPPIKGSTERLEKSPDRATFERLATATVGDTRTSHYRDTVSCLLFL
jgi:hypothetical protein